MDADVTFEAQSVTSPKVPLRSLQLHLVLDRGVLRLDPLSFSLPQGQFAGTVQIDAAKTVPESDIDMNLENIDLAQFKPASAKDPPLQGVLTGRAKLHGRGESVHKFASSADGSMSVVIPHGQIRALYAEATGIDVAHSLGLLLTQDRQQTELRCGVAAFQADQGHLNAKTIVMDTTNVLITGRGSIDLQTERLDLALQGDPKKIRLVRLRAPISVGGSLSKPSVGIKPEKTLLQAGAGTVLAALLTPIAAVLAFVDPGLAKNADCSALMAQVGPEGSGAGEP
jgi:AsmA family protein